MENTEKKTLQSLNSKVWYRLLKVIFGLCVLLVLGVFNFIIINNGVTKIDNNKTTVQCTYGDKLTLTPKQVGIQLSDYQFREGFNYKNFFEGYNDYAIKEILNSCYTQTNNDIDIFAAQKVYEVVGNDRLKIKKEDRPALLDSERKYLDEVIPKIENSSFSSDKTKYLDYSVKLFDIQPVYTYNLFIKYFVLGNLIVLFLFEALRRTFYYVVLGSIRPKK